MRLLLDTHTFLWLMANSAKLSSVARSLVTDPANTLVLSVVSLWEIAIKHSIGKLPLAQPFDLLIPAQLQLHGIDTSPIDIDHLRRVIVMPFHHRDPFDRLIIAQSLVENLPVVSADPTWDAYQVQRLW